MTIDGEVLVVLPGWLLELDEALAAATPAGVVAQDPRPHSFPVIPESPDGPVAPWRDPLPSAVSSELAACWAWAEGGVRHRPEPGMAHVLRRGTWS